MRLDQFDKIDQNVKKAIDLIYRLKFENNKLRRENEQLKSQLDLLEEKTEQLKEFDGNKSTKIEKQKIVNELRGILNKVRSLTEGVEY